MTRIFASPLFLGFDNLERTLERALKTSPDGYPPYTVERISPLGLRITLAVAGFTTDDMQITLEDNRLVIRGRQTGDRGTARPQFQRTFVLADGVDVKGAWLDNGQLYIDLVEPQPKLEPQVRRVIMRSSGMKLHGEENQPRPTVVTSAADERSGHRSEAAASDWTIEVAAGIEALDARTDELLAVAQRAAKTANERADEIDAVLAEIREIRAEASAA